jgi:hypothetical protein
MGNPRKIIGAVVRLKRRRLVAAAAAGGAGVAAVAAAAALFALASSALWGWAAAAFLAVAATGGALYAFWRLWGRGLVARSRLAGALAAAEARAPSLRRRLGSA